MVCLNKFCIYQKNDKCLLEVIELDINGCCEECIYADIPPQILEYEKEKLKKIYETENDIQ